LSSILNLKKDSIQQKALSTHHDFDCFSTLALCTGAGKTRVAILRCREIVNLNPDAKIFLAVPTEKLRDINWKEEFHKWCEDDIYESNLTRACYVSLHKEKHLKETWDLVILDEAHHITENCLPFFFENEIKSILGLTATPPTDEYKKKMLESLAPVSYIYTLQQGIIDGVVSPFEINVIFTQLNDTHNNVEAGSKKSPFMTTEKKSYDFWDKAFNDLKIKSSVLESDLASLGYYESKKQDYFIQNRTEDKDAYISTLKLSSDQLKYLKVLLGQKFITETRKFSAMTKRKSILYNSYSKEQLANKLLQKIYQDKLRFLIFCGSIKQSTNICGNNVFNSSSTSEYFDKFCKKELNILGVVNAVNEGLNIDALDEIIIVQISAKDLHLIQRIGRLIRLRDNFIGKVYILVNKNSQDEVWLKSAIKAMDEIKITYYDQKDFFESL
jgi:superfamily II DNA or RNA helicase